MLSEQTDQHLLRRYICDGSEAAFDEVVRRHLDLVYGAAFRSLNNRAEAEEVAQGVFVLLARRAALLCAHASIAGWLYKTAVNMARERIRSEHRRHIRERTAADLSTIMAPSDSVLEPLNGVLDEAMLELRAADREALLLRYIEKKSLREVGAALGIGEDAAQKRVAKALDELTGRFRKRGFAVGSSGLAIAALESATVAAPSSLALTITNATSAVAVPALLSIFDVLIANLLNMTKTHVAVATALLIAAPLGWNALRVQRARAELPALRTHLAEMNARVSIAESLVAQTERNRDLAKRQHRRLEQQAAIQAHLAEARTTRVPASLYHWSDDEPFVRVPKSIFLRVSFQEQSDSSSLGGYRDAEPILDPSTGVPSEIFLRSLGLNEAELTSTRTALGQTFDSYRSWAESQSYLTNITQPINGVGSVFEVNARTLAWVTPPAPESGAQWRERLQQDLQMLVGSERAEVILLQLKEEFQRRFEDFGQLERVIAITPLDDGQIKGLILRRGPTIRDNDHQVSWTAGSAELLEHRNSVPAALKPHLDSWRAALTGTQVKAP